MKAAELLRVGLALADDLEASGLKSAGVIRALARAVVGAALSSSPIPSYRTCELEIASEGAD